MRSFLLLSALSAGLVKAHIEMMYPLPINSQYDPQTLEANKDYSMTAPLNSDGSNYPCKGYNSPSAYKTLKPVATLSAGSDFDVKFAPGGATHMGGSCQFSVSYDEGETFAVIHSVLGGCPLQSSYAVPIPDDLPAATSATFAWTWQNEVGAIVNIEGSSSESFTGPALFRANTLEDGTCITIEGEDTVYPNPGPSVEYGGKITASTPASDLTPCSFNENQDVTISPSGSSSGGSGSGSGSSSSSSKVSSSKPASTSTKASTTTSKAPTSTSTKVTKTSQLVVQPTTTSVAASSSATATTTTRSGRINWRTVEPSSSSAPMTSASATRSASSTKWVLAPTTTPTPSARASSSTLSRTIVGTASASSSSSPSSSNNGGTSIQCTSSSTWSLCDDSTGVCTPMGNVAPGTVCKGDGIVAERRRMVKLSRKRSEEQREVKHSRRAH
ncbi:hypothetical protein JCM11641_005274 [Rhodosporidiobolus odoratus]